MRLSVALTLAVAALLLFIPIFPKMGMAQPSQGNWVVTGTQVVQGESITLNGNLTVEDGGNLTLRRAVLHMNAQSNGEYGIEVDPGGSLYIYGSSIVAANPSYRFTFVAGGTNFVMKNSTVEGAGWCQATSLDGCWPDPSVRARASLLVESSGSDIESDTISHGAIGLILTGEGNKVERNLIEQNDFSPFMMLGSSGNKVLNNTFYQYPTPFRSTMVLLSGAQNNTITGNAIEELDRPAWSTVSGMDGIGVDDGSHGNLISQNVISVANIGVFPIESSDTTVEDNTITFGEVAVNVIWVGVNTKIIGNKLQGVYPDQTAGVILNLAHNSVMADNSLIGSFSEAIDLDHTDNASLIDNTVASPCSVVVNNSRETCVETQPTGFSLLLSHSRDGAFIGNNLTGSTYGILASSSSDRNLFEDNVVNASHSVTIVDSNSNSLLGNDFYDVAGSSGGPYDNGNNSWYLGQDGNYWGYTGGGEYNRSVVPPDGIETISLATPIPLVSHRIVIPNPLPIPPLSSAGPKSLPTTIKGKTVSIGSGVLGGNVTIVNSKVTLGVDGLVRIGGGSIIIENSTLLDGGYGFVLSAYNPAYPLVVKNSSIDGAYMQDTHSSSIDLEDSKFADSQTSYGITVGYAQSVTIVNSTFADEVVGARFDCGNGSSILVSGNTFKNTLGTAVDISYCTTANVMISDNTLSRSWGNGIDAGGVPGVVIEGNNVSGIAGTAINSGGNGDLMEGNRISDSGTGLVVSGSNCIVAGNIISGITGTGISAGSGNIIYHNNFANDPTPAQGGNDQWSHDGEGNYWGNYLNVVNGTNGRDPDLDGIGDTPYTNGNVQDNYPFMQPDGWLTKFYLTAETNLPAITSFQINGSSFSTQSNGVGTFRLGYDANYTFTLPKAITLPNGTSYQFEQWSDGYGSSSRTLSLSSNSTARVLYQKQSQRPVSTSTHTSSSGNSVATSTTGGASPPAGGQLPGYVVYLGGGALAAAIVVTVALLLRKRTQVTERPLRVGLELQ